MKLRIRDKLRANFVDIWYSQSPDEQFEAAFDGFNTEFQRRLRGRIDELATKHVQLARSPGIDRVATPYVQRNELYKQHIAAISADFNQTAKDFIFDHCDQLSDNHVSKLRDRLTRVFLGQLDSAKSSEERFAASMGHRLPLQAIHAPIESMFRNALSDQIQLLDSTVKLFNLDQTKKRLEDNKKKQLDIIKALIKWVSTGGGIVILGKWILSRLGIFN